MKVYVVTETSYYGGDDHGSVYVRKVFATEDGAKTYVELNKTSNHWYKYNYEEFDLE